MALTEVTAQDRMIDRAGRVRFYSSAPLENIEAINDQALGVLDLRNHKVAVSILMKGFHFEKALMEEHFNENYVESDQYPKATFTGTLSSPVDYSKTGKVEVPVKGEMTIHGVTKLVETMVELDINEARIVAQTVFILAVADYGIKIPSMVISNIAEQVEVTAHFSFQKQI